MPLSPSKMQKFNILCCDPLIKNVKGLKIDSSGNPNQNFVKLKLTVTIPLDYPDSVPGL